MYTLYLKAIKNLLSCFSVESIACSLYYNEEKTKFINSFYTICLFKNKQCSVGKLCSKCVVSLRKRWNQKKKLMSTWQQRINELNLSYVSSPSSLDDIYEIEKQHSWKFHVFELFLNDFRKIHITNISNSKVTANIHLLRIRYVNQDGELVSHFAPVTDISMFTSR